MLILHLDAGLYPDSGSVPVALAALGDAHELRRIDLKRDGITPEDWDAVVDAILAADRVVCG